LPTIQKLTQLSVELGKPDKLEYNLSLAMKNSDEAKENPSTATKVVNYLKEAFY